MHRLLRILAFLALFATTVTRIGSGAASADSSVTVSVTNSAIGQLSTNMSTNNVWSGELDQSPDGVRYFNALHAPLVRLHVGDDGWPAAMPEIQQGQWDFSALDTLVNDVFNSGQQPLMNIKFAPDWMWSCYPNSIGVKGSQGAGTVKDLTFATYAQYMARLVSYYNTGSMTTESGTVITNPAGTSHRITYWEPWNEPDLNAETPCAPSNGLGITAAQYVTMWNAVTSAMLAVDPTLKFVGPATSSGQYGTTYNDYLTKLLAGATVQPSALSFHGYGYWDNTVTDGTIFDGDSTGSGGITEIAADAKNWHLLAPTLPLWIDEVNVNADWGNDPYSRPWTAFGAAWWGSLVTQVAPLGVAMIHEYDLMESPQFGLLNDTTGDPYLPYWEFSVLNTAFPAGSTMLSTSSTASGVQTLAAQRPDGTVAVLVVDRQVNSTTTKGGTGIAATVTVNLQGISPTSVSLQQIDATTSVTTGPVTQTLPVSTSPTVSLPGYGFAVLTIGTSSSPVPTSTPAPPTSTPSATSVPPTSTPSATSVPPTATNTPVTSPTATKTPSPSATPSNTAVPSPAPTQAPAPSPTPTSAASTGLTVYDNTVGAGFTDSSFAYSAKNSCDSTMYFDPTCSYDIAYKAWGAVDYQVASGTMSTAGYTTLSYRLYANGQPISDFGALLTNKSGNGIKEIALTSSMATLMPCGWYQVTIPISKLNPSNVAIKEIQLKNEKGKALNPVHYDDVTLN